MGRLLGLVVLRIAADVRTDFHEREGIRTCLGAMARCLPAAAGRCDAGRLSQGASMLTVDVTPEQMQRQLARFADLQPSTVEFLEREGIPPEAYEMLAARKIFCVMAPPKPQKNATTRSAISGPPGVAVFIVETPPGNGPALHAHMNTVETFLCLEGRYRINYGTTGQHSLELGPLDTVSIPRGCMRQFTNIAPGASRLLVLIDEPAGQAALDDVHLLPETGEQIERRFGAGVKAALERVGNQFTANLP
jgi:quercetin dioxygenase-like cupin family protein